MKEHALFMAVAFPAKNEDLIQEAKAYNQYFNSLLTKAVTLASNVFGIKNDAVTQYTLEAEKATSYVTDFQIDTNLTNYELSLGSQPRYLPNQSIIEEVSTLNNQAIQATQGLIIYKTNLINGVLNCQIYTGNYPLLLDHIRREALFFVDLLSKLQYRYEPNAIEEAIRQQVFWNQIMSEHAKFIRGFLDPTEEDLIDIAQNFGEQFSDLNNKAIQMSQFPQTLPQITTESIQLTKDIQGFKTQGTEGILQCKIKSLIFPLLGDHTIREANHYLNLLESISL